MHDDIIKIVKELVTYPNEEEWFDKIRRISYT